MALSRTAPGMHCLAPLCEAALMLALATGLGFGFGAVVERLATPDPAAGAWISSAREPHSVLLLEGAGDFVYDAALALGSSGEIGPTYPDSRRLGSQSPR